MKKRIAYVLGIILVVASAAFAYIMFNNSSAPSDSSSSKSSSGSTANAGILSDGTVMSDGTIGSDGAINQSGKSTLLIYMIGSDLESRSGAGTDDLEEIEKSGIDIAKANVVVYAGGSKKWHNDLASNEENNILQLGKKGFEKVASMDSSSMGTSDSLLEFLNYGYSNYPSDTYSLIMWDHGNGPVIGYGKDMLFDNDSLTLAEMKNALLNSPFNGDNKLAWVGFDACLMSSAELACIWADHADYMIASQEIEPSFGWNYSVLKSFGVKDTKSFSSELIDDYIDACESYYDEKGYENRDTTLACMDLAYASQLEDAINSVFARASQDVGSNYNTLVQKRVATRALGRASTGSEYDLIDLNDMALQLESVYPEECKLLTEVLNNMIVKNGTNTQGCCGISMYYPFYNKYYFEDSWGQVYADLGLFSDYSNYLTAYQNIWLQSDDSDTYAKANSPQKVSDAPNRSSVVAGTYKLQLTPEQNETYADAKIYVLKHYMGELYHPVMSSENVVWQDGALYADFSGNAIYVKDDFNRRYLPVSTENDTVGNISRYTINSLAESRPDSKQVEFHIALDNSTEEVSLSSLVSRGTNDDPNFLGGGKQEEYQLGDWKSYWIYYNNYGYLTRYPGGAIKPLNEWLRRGALSYYDLPVQNGIEFVYEPLENDKYYIIFEITDTQGSKYCSEMLLIDGEEYTEEVTYHNEDISIDWTEGDEIEFLSSNGVTLTLKKSDSDAPSYVMEVKNDNDFAVIVNFDSILCNGEVYAGSFYANVPAKSIGVSYEVIPNKDDYAVGAITDISSLEGYVTISESEEYIRLELKQKIKINISGEAKLQDLSAHYKIMEKTGPYYGASAGEQVLYRDDEVCVTLLYLGKNDIYSNPGVICVENLTSEYKAVEIDAYCINGVTVDVLDSYYPPPHSKEIRLLSSFAYNLPINKITQIESMSLHVAVYESNGVIRYPQRMAWVPVKLEESAKAPVQPESGSIIFNQNDIEIYLNEYKLESKMPTWYVTVVNNSDNDISFFNPTDVNVNIKVGAHQRTTGTIRYYGEDRDDLLNGGTLYMPVNIMDFYKSKVILECDKQLVLPAVEKRKDVIDVNWENGDSIKLTEENGVALYLKKAEETNSDFNYDWETGEFEILRVYTDTLYFIEAHNSNSIPVVVNVDNLVINKNISNDQMFYINLDPGESDTTSLYMRDLPNIGAISDVSSLSFTVDVQNSEQYNDYLIEDANISVNISGDAVIDFTKNGGYSPLEVTPYMDAMATEQVLWQDDEFKVTLLYFGDSNTSSNCYICFENTSDKSLDFSVDSVGVNSVSDSVWTSVTLLPGLKSYEYVFVSPKNLGIQSIEDLEFTISVKVSGSDDVYKSSRIPVVLSQKGHSDDGADEGKIIFNKGGVRIVLDSVEKGQDDDYYRWNVTVINDNDYGVYVTNNSGFGNVIFYSKKIEAGQRSKEVVFHADKLDVNQISLKVEIYDFYGTQKLFSDDEPITLYVEQ